MDYFAVEHLDVERLLGEWRWLYPRPAVLVARSAFGDLFLEDPSGQVLRLDVHVGEFHSIAEDVETFRELGSKESVKSEEWFAIKAERQAADDGLIPGPGQCLTFATPIVFVEGGYPGNGYVGDIYDAVSFHGELHRQIQELPYGSKVRLVIRKEPEKNPS